jgi:tetratricopeptide (TPR) repeat protein
MDQLEDLLQRCTVRLSLPGGNWGTGFFVAPGLILTCEHVVKAGLVRVHLQDVENWAEAIVEQSFPDPYDIALLRVDVPEGDSLPSVFLDKDVQSRDPLYLFGYPDKDFPNGCPATVDCEGLTGDKPGLIKFSLGQVRPGMSGAPLLNQRTRKVCGMVKFTRDRSSALGGGAISTAVILEKLPDLLVLQRELYESNSQWNSLVLNAASNRSVNQSNSDSTTYQTLTGNRSISFIGGEHHHAMNSRESKPIEHKILMLSANPRSPKLPRRNKELDSIKSALERSILARSRQGRDGTSFGMPINGLKIQASNLSQQLSEIQPFIVCISGEQEGIDGLILANKLNETENEHQSKLIAELFKSYSKIISCIILNGCFCEEQASETALNIDFVVGIRMHLDHKNTIKFLGEFFYQLNLVNSVDIAFNLSLNGLKRLSDSELGDLPILFKKGDEINKRKLEEELSSVNKSISIDQENVELWRRKAQLHTELNQPDQADQSYEKASSLSPKDYEIRTEQGEALEKLGEYEKASNIYDKALELDLGEKDYRIWWKKGKLLVEIKKYSEAVECYDKAAILQPPFPDNYIIFREYGFILRELGKFQESIFHYKKSLTIEPKYRASSYEKKQVYKKMYFSRN